MKRTNTTNRTVFQLADPDVTFDFESHTAIKITVPTGSQWVMPLHWHRRNLDARQIQCLSGRLHVYTSFCDSLGSGDSFAGPPFQVTFTLDQCTSWGPGHDPDDVLNPVYPMLEIELIANQTLHRNLCSMLLDRDVLPDLDSTSLWLKALFWLTRGLPTWRQHLLKTLSHTQRCLTLFAHDYFENHGRIKFTRLWPWLAGQAPEWLQLMEKRSMYWVSYVVMCACYWFGTLACGMKPVYPEYSPEGVKAGK